MSAILLQRINELGAQVLEKSAHINQLRESIKPFIDMPSWTKEEAIVLDNVEAAYNSTEKQSLALHDCEVIEKMLKEMSIMARKNWNGHMEIRVTWIEEYAEQLKEGKSEN